MGPRITIGNTYITNTIIITNTTIHICVYGLQHGSAGCILTISTDEKLQLANPKKAYLFFNFCHTQYTYTYITYAGTQVNTHMIVHYHIKLPSYPSWWSSPPGKYESELSWWWPKLDPPAAPPPWLWPCLEPDPWNWTLSFGIMSLQAYRIRSALVASSSFWRPITCLWSTEIAPTQP